MNMNMNMNMKTFHKLSEQILNQPEQNKQNQYRYNQHIVKQNKKSLIKSQNNASPNSHPNINTNTSTNTNTNTNTNASTNSTAHNPQASIQADNSTVSKQQQLINMKKAHSKKLHEMQHEKDREIQAIIEKYQREKKEIADKFQTILQEKQSYIKMLEEIISNDNQNCDKNQMQTIRQFGKQKQNIQPIKNRENAIKQNDSNTNMKQVSIFPKCHTMYFHQAPLYGDLCYSIQRPMPLKKDKVISQFCSTKKIKSRLTSNQKMGKNQHSESGSKYRSQSSTRNSTSRHLLAPACPPRYCKVL